MGAPPVRTLGMADGERPDGLLIFGTLRDPQLLEIVLGRVAEVQPIRVRDHGVFFAQGALYPVMTRTKGQVADALVLPAPSMQDIERLDYYEAPYDYHRQPIEVSGQTLQVYRPTGADTAKDGPWDLRVWQDRVGAMTREAAVEIMALHGTLPVEALLPRLAPIRARAQARVNAAAHTPATVLRQGPGWDGVTLEAQRQAYSNFFSVEELTLRHRRFDGGESRVERAVFSMADAVVVLPYDPARDVVLLIEQFRPGPYLRGDRAPWSLEAIAGRIDGGESPEDAAHRETQEEAGLVLDTLVPIAQYYPSPGGTNEYLYGFIGLSDLPDSLEGIGGMDSEHEDIRSMVVPFDALMDAVRSGEVQNAPLLIAALQLERTRERLRAAATPA